MTDTTSTTEPPDSEPPDSPDSGSQDTPAVAEDAAPPEVPPAEPPAPVSFWDRPYVERYFVPLLLPVLAVGFVVVYVLNLSRLFLSGHGHIPVIVGTVITTLILLGSTLVSSAAHRLRTSAIILVTAGFILAIMSGGWLVLGHAANKETGPTTLPASLHTKQTITVTAAPGGQLKFTPDSLPATTGLLKVDIKISSGGHTFTFDNTATLFGVVDLNTSGTTASGVAYMAQPGDYAFYCTIPGHRAAGMQGTVHVTGPPVPTLQQALTQAGNPPTAAG